MKRVTEHGAQRTKVNVKNEMENVISCLFTVIFNIVEMLSWAQP